ncbi:M23 family metallopeptidase, partial [bacterium]|nr:M23 family metallopeptidase [bacterium]
TVKKYFRLNPFHQNATLTSPLKGRFCVVQGAGGKSFHYGLAGHFSYDLVRCKNDSTGTPIFAIADGIVSSVHDSEPDLPAGTPVKLNRKANIIEIKHEWATSCYVHNKQYSALVQVGQHVIQGQKIAEIGNSGVSAGPHLHFAVKNQKGYTLPVQFSNLTGYSEKDGVFKPLKTLQTDYEYKVK